jgi:hypothetical protein
MKSHNISRKGSVGRSTIPLMLALAIGTFGCSDDPDLFENIGTIEFALTNTNWANVGGPIIGLNPATASKRLDPSNTDWWAIARDGTNGNVLNWNARVGGAFTGWVSVPEATNVIAHGATSWPGSTSISNRNVAIGWVDTNGTARVKVSKFDSANTFVPAVSLGGGNNTAGNPIPALAFANGKLLMFTVKSGAPPNQSKRAVRFKWADAPSTGVLGSWSGWTNLPETIFIGSGGVAAAATSTSAISVVAVEGCGSTYCKAWMQRINVPASGAPTVSGTWVAIPSGTMTFNNYATPYMVSLGQGTGTNGARLATTRDGSPYTAPTLTPTSTGTWSFFPNSSPDCFSLTVDPALAVENNNGTLIAAATCSTDQPEFTTLTPP